MSHKDHNSNKKMCILKTSRPNVSLSEVSVILFTEKLLFTWSPSATNISALVTDL